ncbi:hypothetical protein HispidOSU_002981, partial [Sigmodon hispidus]
EYYKAIMIELDKETHTHSKRKHDPTQCHYDKKPHMHGQGSLQQGLRRKHGTTWNHK